MAYEGGYTSAINSMSARDAQAAQVAMERQRMAMAALAFQQQQEQLRRQRATREQLGNMLPELSQLGAPPTGAPPGGPQAPPPGAPSVPMQKPQQGPAGGPMGAMPPGPGLGFATPPPAGAPPGAPSMPPRAGPGAPMPSGGPPVSPSWQSMPKPPAAAPGGPMGVPPPPEEPAVMPKQLISVGDLSKLLASKGIKGEQALDMIGEWAPYMDSENKRQLETMKVQNAAQQAALRAYAGVIKNAEQERHNREVERQGRDRVAQGGQRIQINLDKAEAGKKEGLTPETKRFMAEQYWAGDTSVLTNLGRGAQGAADVKALREEIQKVGKEMGKTPKDLAAAMAEFQGMKAGERTLGTRTANVEMAVTEAQNMADIVLDTSKKFARTDFMPVNKALKSWQDNTGSAETRQFGAAVNSFINAYARAISPSGTPTVHDKEHAREMLSTADSDAQVQAVMKTLKQEMEAARKSPGQVKSSMREGFSGRGEESVREFKSEAEAQAAGLKPGTRVKINGVSGTWQ